RERIRKDMLTPSEEWDNEWQEVPGPEAVMICVVQNSKLLPLQGKTLAEVAKLWGKDPMETLFDLLIEDKAFTSVAVFGMSEAEHGAWAGARGAGDGTRNDDGSLAGTSPARGRLCPLE